MLGILTYVTYVDKSSLDSQYFFECKGVLRPKQSENLQSNKKRLEIYFWQGEIGIHLSNGLFWGFTKVNTTVEMDGSHSLRHWLEKRL